MHIHQFEKNVSKVILSRGKDYYNKNLIREFKQIAQNAWRAKILDTDEYFVYIELKNDKIVESYCTCPFDGTCKHEVAAYYAIRESLIQSNVEAVDFMAFFNEKTKAELVDVLVEIMEQYPSIQERWIPKKVNVIKNATHLILQAEEKILKSVNRLFKRGFWQADDFEEPIESIFEVMEQAQQLTNEDPLTAFALFEVCFERISDIVDNCPSWLYEQTLEEMYRIFSDSLQTVQSTEQAIEWTKWLLVKFDQNVKVKKEYLFLMEAAITLSPVSNMKYHILEALQHYTKKTGDKKLAYDLEFQLLKTVGAESEIESFYKKVDIHSTLRVQMIHFAIDRKQYANALTLCAEGIEQDASSLHYRNQYLISAFSIHQMMGNLPAQRTVAFELALGGQLDDIDRLKNLYEGEEELLHDILNDLIEILEQQQPLPNHYPILLEKTYQWERLLKYCQQDIERILRFGHSLQPHYPQEVEILHVQHILALANVASNREHYSHLASIITCLQQLGYQDRAIELKAYLIETYPRKKALHDILNAMSIL